MDEIWPSDVKSGEQLTEKIPMKVLVAAMVVLLAAAVALGGYLYLCLQPQDGILLERTYINELDLSGMTAGQADEALQKQFRQAYSGARSEVALAGETYTVPLLDSLSLDTAPAIQKAMARGHGGFITRGMDYLRSRREDHRDTVIPALTDAAALKAAIDATGIGSVNTVTETTWEIGEDAVTIHKGTPGVSADLEALAGEITAAVGQDPTAMVYPLDCPTRAEEIAPLDLQSIYDQVYVAVQDASVDQENDYAVIPAVTGVGFDLEAASQAYDQTENGAELDIQKVYTEPRISTEFLKKHLFADALGSFATNVSGSDGRRKNVRLAAERCNVILMPGEQFSYNQRVGRRTTDRGFSEAGAYLNGEMVMEVGGGVCQTSSTLYMACVMSNLQIDMRYNHTYPSGYIGLGLDATVSWGGPDFQFTNNTEFPIKITSRYSSGRLSFTIYGSKMEDFSVEVVSEILAGSGKGRTYVSTASSANGGQSVAYTGRYSQVQTYRKLYDGNGNLVSTTKEAYSYYKTHEED